MEQTEEAKKEEKVKLLEKVNSLREERTQLIDHLKTVLAELESKTDKEDSKTLAQIKDYRHFHSAMYTSISRMRRFRTRSLIWHLQTEHSPS